MSWLAPGSPCGLRRLWQHAWLCPCHAWLCRHVPTASHTFPVQRDTAASRNRHQVLSQHECAKGWQSNHLPNTPVHHANDGRHIPVFTDCPARGAPAGQAAWARCWVAGGFGPPSLAAPPCPAAANPDVCASSAARPSRRFMRHGLRLTTTTAPAVAPPKSPTSLSFRGWRPPLPRLRAAHRLLPSRCSVPPTSTRSAPHSTSGLMCSKRTLTLAPLPRSRFSASSAGN